MTTRSLSGFCLMYVMLALPAAAGAQSTSDFFDRNVLQEIRLEAAPGDWQSLRDDIWSNSYYPCTLRWRGLVIRDAGMRSRGGSTRSGIKPGLQIDLGRYNGGARFLGLKQLVMRNNGHDPTMMRESLAMLVYERLGIPAPREAYARLYVNDEYAGLYTLVEAIDKTFLQRVFGENEGYLYSCGYDANDPEFRFEYRGADPGLYSPKPFQPETHEKDPDARPIEAFVRAVNFTPDAEFLNAVSEFIDLRLFAKFLGVEAFIAENDGVLVGNNNFYMYRFEGKNLSELLPWDRGYCFYDSHSIWRGITDVPPEQQNVLVRRALSFPEIRHVYLETLWLCAQIAGGADGWLAQEVERQYNLIHAAALEDQNKLRVGEDGIQDLCPNEVFEASVDQMRQFVRGRSSFVVDSVVAEMEGASSIEFSLKGNAVNSLFASDHSGPMATGYVQVASEGDGVGGLAVIGYRQNDVLVSETSIRAAGTLHRGRMFAQSGNGVRTGLAVVNPNDWNVVLSYSFTDTRGLSAGTGTVNIPAHAQFTGFLDDRPLNGPAAFCGAFSFESSLPVVAIALRGFTNERSEFLLTTLPITNLDELAADRAVIPHLAHGAGWTTQFVLVNPTDTVLEGELLFYDSGGLGLELTIGGPAGSRFAYSIPPKSARLLQTSGSPDSVLSGSAHILPSPGQTAPSSFAVVSFRVGGITVSAAGITARSGTALRIPAESSGDFEAGETSSFQTGIAIANPSENAASVRLELTGPDGSEVFGAQDLTIPANGQRSLFINQIEDCLEIPTSFQGILRVSTPSSADLAVAALRGRINERHEFLVSTTDVMPETAAGTTLLFLPQFAAGGGYSTQFIFMNRTTGNNNGAGTLRFYDPSGAPLKIVLF